MALSDTMRWMGRSARNRAEAMSHQVKDRALSARLDRAAEENDRLRTENRTLRDAVEESRTEHDRILTLLEGHHDQTEAEADEGGSHRGRWFMFLMLLAGGAWAWVKSEGGRGLMDRAMGGDGRSVPGDQTLGGMTSAA